MPDLRQPHATLFHEYLVGLTGTRRGIWRTIRKDRAAGPWVRRRVEKLVTGIEAARHWAERKVFNDPELFGGATGLHSIIDVVVVGVAKREGFQVGNAYFPLRLPQTRKQFDVKGDIMTSSKSPTG